MSEGLTIDKLVACREALDRMPPVILPAWPTLTIEQLARSRGRTQEFMGFKFVIAYRSINEAAKDRGLTWHQARNLWYSGHLAIERRRK